MDEPDEEVHYIDRPITKYEALSLIQPLRIVLGDVVGSMVDATSALVAEATTSDGRAKSKSAFDRLRDVFDQLNDFDTKSMKMLEGLSIEDSAEGDGESHE